MTHDTQLLEEETKLGRRLAVEKTGCEVNFPIVDEVPKYMTIDLLGGAQSLVRMLRMDFTDRCRFTIRTMVRIYR